MFEQIEKLKQDFTDKYVVVDAGVPELARFEGHVGQVKTVNMSGRALVQFDAWSNIGWYDIEPEFLKVVPKPEAPPEGKKHETPKAAKPAAAKPPAVAGEKKLSPLEMARMQGAAKSGGAKPAAAPSATQKPAAPAGTTKPKMSTADILAAARDKKAAEGAAAQAAPQAAATEVPAAEAPAPAEAASTAPTAAKPAPAAKPAEQPAFTPGQRPSVPEILDWCRQHDAK